MCFLDIKICDRFREVINKTDIFIYDEDYSHNYNLICAIMDRVENSVEYLNKNSETPKNEQSLLLFVMYSCMLLDAIKQLFKVLCIESIYSDEKNSDSYKYFKTICMGKPLKISEENCPTDDKFFEYFRSLSMAHPLETSRPRFLEKKEIQYSPWVIVNSAITKIRGVSDGVGIRIYSNKSEEIQDLLFPFNILKEYINSRYVLMKKATEKVNQIIYNKQETWKKEKVIKDMSPIESLNHVIELLDGRYEDEENSKFLVETAIDYLTCNLTEPDNKHAVSEYKKAILASIPNIIQAIDTLNYEHLSSSLRDVIHVRPNKMHNSGHYELEKIFNYLNDNEFSSNYSWGILQVKKFMMGFASKWVSIDTKTMSVNEIKLLIDVACYLEDKEQKTKS
ncbi:hypothetical protein MKA31_19695 [[Clostridium] innocuum]|nr:hypothetical protein [[Clostridium] innocuum]